LTRERGWRIILDDRQARLVARRLGISITGTVGILVRAKRSGIIPSLKPLLSKLEVNQFYISNVLKEEALRLANE
jgi:predicted nucleic acid-binding protein